MSPAGNSVSSPPSTSTSAMGSFFGGVSRFFGLGQDDAVRSPVTAADVGDAADTSSKPSPSAAAGGSTTFGAAADSGASSSSTARGDAAEGAGAGAPMEVSSSSHDMGQAAMVAGGGALAGVAGAAGVAAARDSDGRSRDSAPRPHVEGGAGMHAVAAGREDGGDESREDAAAAAEDSLRGRSLSPEEVQAYSDNVDRTLQVRDGDCGDAKVEHGLVFLLFLKMLTSVYACIQVFFFCGLWLVAHRSILTLRMGMGLTFRALYVGILHVWSCISSALLRDVQAPC